MLPGARSGFDGEGLIERILQVSKIQINRGTPERPDCWPDIDEYYRNKMRELIRGKAHVASRVHGSSTVGGRPLNELFADPDELMKRLQQGGYIDVNRPSQSSFFELLKFDGPMYKILLAVRAPNCPRLDRNTEVAKHLSVR